MPVFYRDGKATGEKPEAVPSAHHHGEWIDAVLGKTKETVCDFSYAGPMTEVVLLGTVAILVPGETLHWDASKLRFTNSKAANAYVREPLRKGWEVRGL